MSSDSPRLSSRSWLESVVEALGQQLHSASQGADINQTLSESHVELLTPILSDMRVTLEGDEGTLIQHMLRSLMELCRPSAPISGFSYFTRTAAETVLYLAGSHGAVLAEFAIDAANVDLEESPGTVVNQGPTSNTYRGTYRGQPALFKEYRALESHSRQGIDVKMVAVTQTLLRTSFPGSGLVPIIGIWQPHQGFDHRTFLVEDSTPASVDLANYLLQNPGVDRLLLLKDVVEAFASLHANHLVLGPITQQSLIVAPSGRAYLSNFDYLRFGNSDTPFIPMLISLDAIRWMAPELVRPFKEERESPTLTKAGDMYSLGCLMLWLLTGRSPFAEYNQYPRHMLALITAVIEKGPAEISTGRFGLTDEMWTAIGVCCAREPTGRPSVSDILNLAFLDGLVDNRTRN